jgi:hypothetical protein
MPLEARIRRGLGADASSYDPASDSAMGTIIQRGPRRRIATTIARTLTITAITTVFVLVGAAAVRTIGEGRPEVAARPVPPALVSPLDGQWRMTLSIEDAIGKGFGYGRASQLAGTRQLELASGVVRQIRPGSFETLPVNGLFEVDGPFLFIYANHETLVMRWTLSGDELQLTLVGDSRHPRQAREDRLVWTTKVWRRIG